jgi:superfamily I DNA and/or RNA helicase
VSQGAKSLVLLGDPRQLDQPQQGSHPDGCGVSALDHLLGDRLTIPSDRGLFLAETYRLHPDVCAFTSEMFYESRLRSLPGLERQSLATPAIEGAGLWMLPVTHDGRVNSAPEEVETVAALIERVLARDARWTDRNGATHPLVLDDILVVAPFNAQVADLVARIPGVRAGTVDKFQGQQAPLVIYSMTTSNPEDAPRGMEFLYSLNRLNVATSRARCACVLVANPRLFEPECRTPKQMRMANAFCRYRELALALSVP